MLEIKGKYATAKIFAEIVDEGALAQIQTLCDQPVSAGSKIRIMPDVHAGVGCTIGTTMTVTDAVIPNLVGVDIGCGMETVRLKEKHLDLQKLDQLIYRAIPSGFQIRREPHRLMSQFPADQLKCRLQIDVKRMMLSMGTLGGGNHFIEADQGEEGSIYLVIHSGSRNLGKQVAQWYQEEAYRRLNRPSDAELSDFIERLCAEGKEAHLAKALQGFAMKPRIDLPMELAYATGELFADYIHDMKLTQQYAMLNRQAMMEELIHGMDLHVEEQFTTVHNYIDTDRMILRKGAVSARQGEKLLIPINMRDGSLICIGKGNDDWNQSAPHGAGRLLSRSQAKAAFSVQEYRAQMQGIYTTSVGSGTLDECPMAYKPADAIIGCIGDTAEIVEQIHPIYNFKANG